jgi:hypothetical protein
MKHFNINKYTPIQFHFQGQFCQAIINNETLDAEYIGCDGIELNPTNDILKEIHKVINENKESFRRTY